MNTPENEALIRELKRNTVRRQLEALVNQALIPEHTDPNDIIAELERAKLKLALAAYANVSKAAIKSMERKS